MVRRSISVILVFAALLFALCACKEKPETPGAQSGPADNTEPASGNAVDIPLTKTLRFLAAGDNIIHECVYLDAATVAASTGSSRSYYFDSMYSDVEEAVCAADISFINAEGPLNTDYAPSGYPNFNAPSEAGDALVSVGFDVINLANNHMLDLKSGIGMQGTIDYWKGKSVVTIGAYENRDDYNNIRVVEKEGVKIAFLSYTYGTNGITLGSNTPSLYIPYIDDAEITRQIAEARRISDLVFVSMHWGNENEFAPTSEQKRLASLIADCGADAVIGHHSHTLQPIEWITGREGNRTLVAYSLGNFLHTQLNSKNLVGGVLTFDITSKEGEKPSIENVVFVPTVCHYTANKSVLDSLDYYKRENLHIYWLSDYTEELAARHGSQNWGAFSLSTLRSYVTDTISSEFLPQSYR